MKLLVKVAAICGAWAFVMGVQAQNNQTNMSLKAMPTSGEVKEFRVVCPTCYNEFVLAPRSIKVKKITKGLGGRIQHAELYFSCPRCQHGFMNEHDKWLPDAIELPLHHNVYPTIGVRTNVTITPVVKKLTSPKKP